MRKVVVAVTAHKSRKRSGSQPDLSDMYGLRPTEGVAPLSNFDYNVGFVFPWWSRNVSRNITTYRAALKGSSQVV